MTAGPVRNQKAVSVTATLPVCLDYGKQVSNSSLTLIPKKKTAVLLYRRSLDGNHSPLENSQRGTLLRRETPKGNRWPSVTIGQ